MIKVMFWNVNRRGNEFCSTLYSLAQHVDILLLTESKIDDAEIKNNIGLEKVPYKSGFYETELTPKLYTKIPLTKIEHYSSAPSKRMVFYNLQTIEYGEIIVAGIHFPSKTTYHGQTQLSLATSYSNWLYEIENQRNHTKTVLFGDFNMNPYEAGMIEPQAFNATLLYDVAKEGQRTFHYQKFHYFYNPMWNWLGDREYKSGVSKLPGSFYYKTTDDVTQIYWNVFDKVIVRPSIIDAIDYATIEIHDVIPMSTLIKQDFNKKSDNFTDHLPLTFNLKITI